MMLAGTPELQRVQLRLARHYLTKLRTASVAISRGQASVSYGFELFDQEWEQLEQWQACSAGQSRADKEWMRLCLEYSLAGLGVLSIRRNLADQARWLESGREAALQLGEGRAELAILNELVEVYLRLSSVEKAELYADRLLQRAYEVQDRLSIGRGYYALGSVAEERGHYPEALDYTHRALNIFTELSARTDEGRALYNLGAIALYLADFDKAYQYFQRHLELMETTSSMSEVCKGLLSVAQALLMLEAHSQAEAYIHRAVRLSRRLGFQRLLGAGLIMLAQHEGEQGQIELEMEHYQEGIAAARAAGSQRDVIHGLSNLGYARFLQGDLEGALLELEEGLQLARQAGNPRFLCNLQRNITDTYLALNDLEAARSALKETVDLALELNSSYQMVKALTSAIGYWQIRGCSEQAAHWAGNILDRPEVDHNLFNPICERLEAALGPEAYRNALEAGRGLDLKEILSGVSMELAQEYSRSR